MFPTGHGRLAVIIVYKRAAGTHCSSTTRAFIFSFLYKVVCEALNENIVPHLKSKFGNHCPRRGLVRSARKTIPDCPNRDNVVVRVMTMKVMLVLMVNVRRNEPFHLTILSHNISQSSPSR